MNPTNAPIFLLFLSSVLSIDTPCAKAQPIDTFANQALNYAEGAGIATDFATGAPYNLTEAALAGPSRVTPGEFGGPVDPFSPPYLRDQLLSVGVGGSVTFVFAPPLFDQPGSPYGLDFTLFGSNGWAIVNGDFSGGGITDGSQFGANEGETQVWVSADGVDFFLLDPALAPVVDRGFPTDGLGDPSLPVDPALTQEDFDGADLDAIRSLYNGSAGGASYDIAWAMDAGGTPVSLPSISHVRVDVLSGRAEIDAISAVGASMPNRLPPSDIATNFSQNPFDQGWQVHGENAPFAWDEDTQELKVRWNSRGGNRFFYRPLGGTLSLDDDFELSFEATFESISVGTTEDKPGAFPIAISLLNWDEATRPDFFRGSGVHSTFGPRGVFEWAYFPDGGFGATVSSGAISLSNQWAFQNTFPLELPLESRLSVALRYDARTRRVYTEMLEDGAPMGPIQEAIIPEGFDELGLDTIAVSVYSDEGQGDPRFAGSVSAVATIHALSAIVPKGPRLDIAPAPESGIALRVEAPNEGDYWLESATDFQRWRTIDHAQAINGESIEWQVGTPPSNTAIYRVRFSPQPDRAN